LPFSSERRSGRGRSKGGPSLLWAVTHNSEIGIYVQGNAHDLGASEKEGEG